MSSPPLPETIYLEPATEPVCAILHRPADGSGRDTAVLLCPPFGFDEVCSYRARRYWAQRLATSGYACLRVSLPGTGDSAGSPRDPGRIEAWTETIDRGARWLREATGARRVVAIGLGLGGLIAYRAAAAGAPIEDFVLWGTPSRGRALVRQLRAFSKLEASQFFHGLEQPPPLAPGELEAGGFLLSAETVKELGELDLAKLALPPSSSPRALLLEQDGIAVDGALAEQLQSRGTAVTVAPGKGYETMTSHPQRARPPVEVIERVTAWLDQSSSPAALTPAPVAHERASAQLRVGDAEIRETPLRIEQPFGNLEGVLAEPLGQRQPGLCALFLNAGAVRRIGPNRMWTEAARRWAARGVPSLRFDVEGIGDADGETTPYVRDGSLYARELVPQVLAAVELLHRRGVGERFVLAGLCAGAYWAFHAALRDARVSTALMLNPQRLISDPNLAPARDFRRLMANLTSWSKIRREASRDRVIALARWLLDSPRRLLSRLRAGHPEGQALEQDLDAAFDQLRATGTRMMLLFSGNEPLDYEFTRSGRKAQLEQWETVTLEYVPVRDHTLRPIWGQQQAHRALDRALERELELGSVAQSPAGVFSEG